VDISVSGDRPGIVACNLSLQPVPFPDNHFDSVSAYDFFEHVPRVFPTADFQATRFPFIELMSEVWRVLKPGGLLYASTPAFPHQDAFVDPTHVNVMTISSHLYFARPSRIASMYGFRGDFATRRVELARPAAKTLYVCQARNGLVSLKRWMCAASGKYSHVIWELEALK
jgi:SAM-dependent methyltransferase